MSKPIWFTHALDAVPKPALKGWAARVAVEDMREFVEAEWDRKSSIPQERLDAFAKAHARKKAPGPGECDFKFALAAFNVAMAGMEPPAASSEAEKFYVGQTRTAADALKARGLKWTGRGGKYESKKHGFVAAVDNLAEAEGSVYVVDFVTSSGIYAEARLRTAAIAIAYAEVVGEKPRRAVACVPKDGSTPSLALYDASASEMTEDGQAFLRVLGLYKWLAVHDPYNFGKRS